MMAPGLLTMVAQSSRNVVTAFLMAFALSMIVAGPGFAEDAAISADLNDIGFFTAHAAELFAKALPNAKVEVVKPLALTINLPGRGPMNAALDNVYSFCRRNPKACERGLIMHVANMAASFSAPREPAQQSALRAIVRSRAMVESADRAYARRGGATVAERLIGDLWVLCAIDLPGSVGILNIKDLAALKLTREEALAICKQNVGAALPPLGPLKRDYPWPGVDIVTGDAYDSSWLLFPERWTAIAEKLDGDLLVAAPGNDVVIYCSGRATDSVAGLAQAAAFVAERTQKPLSTAVFRWTPTGWEEAGP